MKVFGIELWRPKQVAQNATPVPSSGGGWFSIIKEAWGGAWQSDVSIGSDRDILAFSAVFSCLTIIAADISKLCIKLMKLDETGIGELVKDKPDVVKLLKKPNHYQNRKTFFEQWVISKLMTGNAYVLKVRNKKKKIEALHVLDPRRVTVLVAESGDVYYKLARDDLSGLTDAVVVPASEIIHDLMNPLWHPLVGVSPIYACGITATMGNKIQKNSTKFFNNMSRPSGALTTTQTIGEETANRMKKEWEENFGGEKIGRLAVLGDGLKYEPMTIPANEAQLIEQLKWTVEDVARCFHVPIYKIGGAVPPSTSIEALNQVYYADCLQTLIESIEICLDEGLELEETEYTELDLENLLRMDTAARYEAKGKAVGAGWMSPDEARRSEDLRPVPGGNTPYLQQQNYSLAALAKRDAKDDPFATNSTGQKPPNLSSESDDDETSFRMFADLVSDGLSG